jgi:hypothetical protein
MNRVYTPIFPQSILYTGIPDIKTLDLSQSEYETCQLESSLFTHKPDFLLRISELRFQHLGFVSGDLLMIRLTHTPAMNKTLLIKQDHRLNFISAQMDLDPKILTHIEGEVLGLLRLL